MARAFFIGSNYTGTKWGLKAVLGREIELSVVGNKQEVKSHVSYYALRFI